MTAAEILDKVLPVTNAERKCAYKMQKLMFRRKKLANAITAYLAGETVNWEMLKINVNIEQLINGNPGANMVNEYAVPGNA